MKSSTLYRLLLAAPFPAASLVLAQTNPPITFPLLELDPPRPHPVNRFTLGYRPAFNLSATFKGLGGLGSATAPWGNATGGDVDRNYDNGYNLRDSTTGDGLTWNWGYKDPVAQIDSTALLLSRYAAAPTVEAGSYAQQPQHGVELGYQRQLAAPWRVRVGVDAAFNFTDVIIRDSRNLSGSVTEHTDAYNMGGVTPPGLNFPPTPPDWAYRGDFFGPGPLISDTPVSRPARILPDGLHIEGQRQFDASIYGVRLGPYLELPVSEASSFFISGGLALAMVDSHFRFDQSTSVPGIRTEYQSGNGSHSDLVLGGYVAGSFSIALSRSIDLFGGVQYQMLEKYHQTVNGITAELDLGKTLFATVGVGYSF